MTKKQFLKLVIIFLPLALAIWVALRSRPSFPTPPPLPSEIIHSIPTIKIPNPFQHPILVAVGDIACNFTSNKSTECQQQRVADLIDKINPNSLLLLGDLQYEKGEYENFLNYFDKSFGKFKDKSLPTLGNHEYGTRGASGYFQYFPNTPSYYSLDVQNWHLIALDSNFVSKDQLGWLEEDLQKNQAKSCTLAFFHHPLFSSGTHGNNTYIKPFWDLFFKYKLDLVLNGHDHTYERFSPQSPIGDLDPNLGITEFVAGTGGRNLYSFPNIKPNSEIRFNKTFGVLKLTLKKDSVDYEFIPIEGDFKDQGSIKCH